MGNKINPKNSDYKKEKWISLLLTLVIVSIISYIIFSFHITFSVENPDTQVAVAYDSGYNEHFNDIETGNTQPFETDSLGSSSIVEKQNIIDSVKKSPEQKPESQKAVVKKAVTPPVVKTSAKKNIPKETKTDLKNNKRRLISYIPGTMGKPGKLPVNNCKVAGTIDFFYTVDKEGAIIKVWKKSGKGNACLEKTGISWIKKYVKLNRGTKEWTGIYTIKFK